MLTRCKKEINGYEYDGNDGNNCLFVCVEVKSDQPVIIAVFRGYFYNVMRYINLRFTYLLTD